MRKVEGLRFLREHFDSLCADWLLVERPCDVLRLELDPQPNRVWRVRTGRRVGPEIALPYGSFYTIPDLVVYIEKLHKADPDLYFIISRLTREFFSPLYLGTIVIKNTEIPGMDIEFQAVTPDKIASMTERNRPRDWPVSVVFRYDFFGMLPRVYYLRDPRPNLSFLKSPLTQLWRVGRIIDSLTEYESVTRFNLYATGEVVLFAHRSVRSFGPAR